MCMPFFDIQQSANYFSELSKKNQKLIVDFALGGLEPLFYVQHNRVCIIRIDQRLRYILSSL